MIRPPNDAEGFSRWLEEHKASSRTLMWAKGRSLQEFWDTCEHIEGLLWLLDTCGFKWGILKRMRYGFLMASERGKYKSIMTQELAHYKRMENLDRCAHKCADESVLGDYYLVMKAAWNEYEHVAVTAIRTVVGYPFDKA